MRRQIENLVDQRSKMPPGLLDVLYPVALHGRKRIRLIDFKDLGKAENRVQAASAALGSCARKLGFRWLARSAVSFARNAVSGELVLGDVERDPKLGQAGGRGVGNAVGRAA